MAYKFQLGPATLSGSITHKQAPVFSSGFNNNDQNITNVGVLEADTIQSDADGTGLNINFDGNTTKNLISLKDNLADALNITASDGSFLKFVTSNSAEMMEAGRAFVMSGSNFVGFHGFDSYISGSDANTIVIDGKTSTLFKQDDTLKATINSSGLSVSGQLSASANLLVGGEITGSSINLGTAAGIAGTGLQNNGGTLRIAAAAAGTGLTGGGGSALSLDLNSLSTVAITTSDVIPYIDSSDSNNPKKATMSQLANILAGDGLAPSSGALTVGVDDSSIETNSDALRVKAGGIATAMLADDAVTADKLASDAVVNASIASGAAIDLDKLDGGSCAASLSDLAQGDLLYAGDVDDSNNIKSITFSNLEDAIFGNVTGDATIAAGGALTIAATSVENGMLAGSIANAKLANSSVTITAGDGLKTGGAVSLGGSVTVDIDVSDFAGTGLSGDASENLNIDAAQTGITSVLNTSLKVGRAADTEYIDFGTDNQIHFVVDDNPVARAVAGTFIVDGNLHVSGTTTSVDSTTINISSSFTFEGPVDAHETILTCGTPAQDNTITLPQFSASAGGGTYHIPVLTGATTAASALVTPAEFALLDGASTIGTTAVATGHGIMMNHAGTMAQTTVATLSTFLAGDGIGTSSGALIVNVDDSSIETNSDTLRIKASGVTNAMLAGTIAHSKLATVDSGKVIMGNGSNVATATAISGDIALTALGAASITANAVHASMLNTDIISGLTDIGADIVSTDELLISDAGTIRRTDVSRLKTFIGAANVAAFGNANATLEVGVNYSNAAPAADRTLTLPASAGMVVGQSVKVKANADMDNGNYIIARAGSQTIDGATSITLESPLAAVELVYVATDLWKVF